MSRMTWAACLLSVNALAQAAPAPDVTAVLTHETRAVGADGVTRTTLYQERFTRAGTQLWMQRLVPSSAPRLAADDDGHAHPDFTLAGRHITRGADGKAQLTLVLPAQRVRVPLTPVDHEEAGFSDCWPCAVHLIDPASLARMHRLGSAGGLTRYESRNREVVTRIVWDDALQLPREVVSRRLDGSRSGRLQVKVDAAAVTRPWLASRGYLERSMADFGD